MHKTIISKITLAGEKNFIVFLKPLNLPASPVDTVPQALDPAVKQAHGRGEAGLLGHEAAERVQRGLCAANPLAQRLGKLLNARPKD